LSQTIKSIKDLSSATDKYIYFAVDKVGEMVKGKIDEFIRYYYEEFTPNRYSRTYNFLNSCVKTVPRKIKGGYEVDIYIDTSITYSNGWTMAQTANYANHSLHGNFRVGDMEFWDDAVEEINEGKLLVGAFSQFMKDKGIVIIYR